MLPPNCGKLEKKRNALNMLTEHITPKITLSPQGTSKIIFSRNTLNNYFYQSQNFLKYVKKKKIINK